MNVTIGDIYSLPEFAGMKLIAGDSGLDNVVSKCGILDYEYDNKVKNKYRHTNFCEGQFVLTSFLYARDNEFWLLEAVKNLISKGCSGLAIKNIFKIKLNAGLLHYANQKKFPIFLINEPDLYFEDIIVRISELVRNYASVHYIGEQIDALIHTQSDHAGLSKRAKEINPSFQSDLLVLFYRFEQKLSFERYLAVFEHFYRSLTLLPSDTLFCYKNGFVLIHTKALFKKASVYELTLPFLTLPAALEQNVHIGVSDIRHHLFELKDALTESIAASVLSLETDRHYHLYQDLGVFQILLPFEETAELTRFSQKYIHFLQDHDDENQTKLLETVVQFVLHGGDIVKTAHTLQQHKNTIRYRLEKVSMILDENILAKEHYENISMAIKIYLCKNAMQRFKEATA